VQLSAGTALLPFQDARNPKVVLAPAPRLPLYVVLRAVTVAPLLVMSAPQLLLICCPLAKVQVTVQPLIAVLPAVTRTSAWKPPDQLPVIVYVAEQSPGPAGGVVAGGVVGRGVAVAVGVGLPPEPPKITSLHQ
jgi:hypothetical protein